MPVFNTRNVAAKKAGAAFDVSLREFLFFPDGAKAFTDHHDGEYPKTADVTQDGSGHGAFAHEMLENRELDFPERLSSEVA